MKVKEIIKYLHNYQKWRRGADLPMPNPKELGIAIDGAIRELRNFQRLKIKLDKKSPKRNATTYTPKTAKRCLSHTVGR